ncbi:G patch domain-containing protein 1-like isoform X3 [Salvelinus alpinus]|uniref:G patch domain-containing protein 1-like isoform X3 n=1 Tax=Salvelinus alpinus TaxID=8036 RepID=UPI0039FCCA6D
MMERSLMVLTLWVVENEERSLMVLTLWVVENDGEISDGFNSVFSFLDVVFKTPSGPAPAPPPQDQEMEEEEFGPRLPPASSTLTAERRPSPTPSAKDDKLKKKCKEKHKAKKHGKHKKDKKKKKHKRHKHKAKQKKSSRKEESSDSSSEGSDGNSQEDGEEGGGVSTEELLRRLKSIRGKNLQ